MILLVLLLELCIKLYIRITGILNGKSDVKIHDEIKVTFESAIYKTWFLNIFVDLFN